MKASEALAQIEQDQAKALERFFDEWDEICLDTKDWVVGLSHIDISSIRLKRYIRAVYHNSARLRQSIGTDTMITGQRVLLSKPASYLVCRLQ